MSLRRGAVARLLAAILVAPSGSVALAQSLVPPPPAPPTSAGWTITPAVAVASLWDDNVPLLSEAQGPIGDLVTAVSPSLGSHFRGRRGQFLLDYRGTYEFYRRLTQFDAADHRGRLEADHRLTRTVALFARNSFTHTPTTDIPGFDTGVITLRRRTTNFNDFRGGVLVTPRAHTLVELAYGSQWVDLVDDESVQALLRGGHSHRGDVRVQRQFSERLVLGGAYDFQHAIVSGGTETFDLQHARGLVEVALSSTLVVTGSAGYAWQLAGQDQPGQSAPAVQARLRYLRNRTMWEFGYDRAFMPSFGFGGTVQNEELRGSLHVPFGRKFEVSGLVSARENDPLTTSTRDTSLRALSAQATFMWTLASRLRLELFAVQVFQDSQQAGGRVDRSRAGIRLVTHHPVRLR